jgi:hypothetical protein
LQVTLISEHKVDNLCKNLECRNYYQSIVLKVQPCRVYLYSQVAELDRRRLPTRLDVLNLMLKVTGSSPVLTTNYTYTNYLTQSFNFMDLRIHKSKKSSGKFHHRVPRGINSNKTRAIVMKEITKYIEENNDFGDMNYLACEARVTSKLDPYTTYVYEDLYSIIII